MKRRYCVYLFEDGKRCGLPIEWSWTRDAWKHQYYQDEQVLIEQGKDHPARLFTPKAPSPRQQDEREEARFAGMTKPEYEHWLRSPDSPHYGFHEGCPWCEDVTKSALIFPKGLLSDAI